MSKSVEFFHKRLREARLRSGLTQGELANLAEITPASVSAYEKGGKRPSLDFAAKLANILNVSLDWLCGDTGVNGTSSNDCMTDFEGIVKALITLQRKKLACQSPCDSNSGVPLWHIIPEDIRINNILIHLDKLQQAENLPAGVASDELLDVMYSGLVDLYKNESVEFEQDRFGNTSPAPTCI